MAFKLWHWCTYFKQMDQVQNIPSLIPIGMRTRKNNIKFLAAFFQSSGTA